MQVLQGYLNRGIADVLIDESPQLMTLVAHARSLKNVPFSEKLPDVKQLVLGAMDNACEAIRFSPDTAKVAVCRKIVGEFMPMSYALEHRAGCCRYQGALMFVLGYEANMGDRHFIQYAFVSHGVTSVFNDVFDMEELHRMSIFFESLKDKSLDYSVQNPMMFDDAISEKEYEAFFSYHRQHDGNLIMIRNNNRHVLHLP